MAKVTGQSVPSEDKHLYEAALELARPDGVVRKRFPKRIIAHPLPAKLAQQARFKKAILLFHGADEATRQRWYANRPIWGSFLWYYNYFMMSGLAGNANIPDGGAGVIKSIQVVKESVPTTGTKSFAIDTVDPAKCVVMIQGNSFISDTVHHYDGENLSNTEITVNLSPSINVDIAEIIVSGAGGYLDIVEGSGGGEWADWAITAVNADYIKIKAKMIYSGITRGWAIEIIEHKAQTVYPVLVSIAANAVVIDWALVPSVAADVSITVIEYI